jgi:hypothetical protein
MALASEPYFRNELGNAVTARFALPEVMQCAGVGPYRPDVRRNHDSFKHLYPGGQAAPASSQEAGLMATSGIRHRKWIDGR